MTNFPGRIDEVFDVVVEQAEHLRRMNLLFNLGNQDVNNVVSDNLSHRIVVGKVVVLRRHNDSIDALGYIVVAVFHRHLALGIGAEIFHNLSLLAYLSQSPHDEMCQVDGHRHIVLSLVACISEHHSLVAGTLIVVVAVVDTTVDVVALLVDGRQDAA